MALNTKRKDLLNSDSLVSLALGLGVVLLLGILIARYFSNRMNPQMSPEAAKTENMTPIPLPATYTVKAGDSLWTISEAHYKTGYNWVDIRDANSLTNPDRIEVGQQLSVPDVKPRLPEGQISASETTMVKPKVEQYTVQSGDSLWNIAVAQYNDGYRWVDIAKANKLANPDLIFAGNVFMLPTLP